MARPCTVCTHPDRSAVDQALVEESAFRYISERFGISTTALFRHKQQHLPAHLAQAHQAQEAAQADDLLAQLQFLAQETRAILREARQDESKDNHLALKAIARAEKQIELQARLLGELQDTQVNVLVLPQWQQIRSNLLQALGPYPEARVAVAAVLTEGTHAGP